MFFQSRKSVLAELENEDPVVRKVIKGLDTLRRFSEIKLSYVNRFLSVYGKKMDMSHLDFKKEQASGFLEANKKSLESVSLLLKEAKAARAGERVFKHVFKEDLKNFDVLISSLDKVESLLSREIVLLKKAEALGSFYMDQDKGAEFYHIYSLMSACVVREVDLLKGSCEKTQKTKVKIASLLERVRKHKRMPVVKSRFYHGSPFPLNVGDKILPSKPRMDKKGKVSEVEEIFEKVRRERFPDRPSRFGAMYVDTDPLNLGYYGIIYAVEVKGKYFATDQEIFTEACEDFGRGYKSRVYEWAEAYWSGRQGASIPEVIVNGEVTVLGLADFIDVGDEVRIISDDICDDEGMKVPKGTLGRLRYYDKREEELPFEIKLSDGRSFFVPASAIEAVRKR
jgi:hypothetical protein